jgi:two-component system, NarL family, response regulator LiaR
MEMVRIVICDDQDIVREGLKKILESESDIEVVGLAADGSEAVEMAVRLNPDLTLMDLKMPIMNGIQATASIHQRMPEAKILVLTTYDDDEWVIDAIRNGASGYLLKDTPRADLIRAIHGTVAGENFIDPSVAGKLFSAIHQQIPLERVPGNLVFSEREREILSLLAHGMTNLEIARKLFLSEGTVRNYTSTIFAKLGVADRTQAAILALRYGLVDQPSS